MKYPLIISLIAFFVAALFSLLIYPLIQNPLNLNIDPDEYGKLASNIYSGYGFRYFPSANDAVDKAPLYPYFLAVIFHLSGGMNVTLVQIVQAVFHSLTSLLIFNFVKKLTGYRSAMVAQIIIALHPILIWYTARMWVESIYIFLFTATCVCYVKLFESPKIKNSLVSGVLTGITSLTKSIILFLPIVLLFIFYFKKGVKGIISMLVVILVSVIVISPWIIRNYRISDSQLFIHATMGQNLILGNSLAENWIGNPLSNMHSWVDGYKKINMILYENNINLSDPKADIFLIRYHIERVVNNPEFLIWRSILNFLTFWYLSESPIKSIFFFLLQIPLVIIFIVSLKSLVKNYDCSWIIILSVGYYCIVHAIIIGWGRYSVPLIPILVCGAVAGFRFLSSKFLLDKYSIERF